MAEVKTETTRRSVDPFGGLSTPRVSDLQREVSRTLTRLSKEANTLGNQLDSFSDEMNEQLGAAGQLLYGAIQTTVRGLNSAMRRFDSSDPKLLEQVRNGLESSQRLTTALESFRKQASEISNS